MNHVNVSVLTGNVTNDAKVKKGQESGKLYAEFGLAVNHGKRETSFINVAAFEKLAEWAEKHVTKGRRYSVVGRLEGRSGRAKVIASTIDFQDFPREEEPTLKQTGKKAARKKAEQLRPEKKESK